MIDAIYFLPIGYADIFILKLISSSEIELKTLKQLLEETGETKSSKCFKSYVN